MLLVCLGLLLSQPLALPAPVAPAADQHPQPLPTVAETVEVTATTPVDGVGLPAAKIPADVQVVSRDRVQTGEHVVTTPLQARVAGVVLDEAYGSALQPDLIFRGFTASPLLGSPQGLAVYQDGVRVNEPFGDTVAWELLPDDAIDSITLIPGSNPLFGLNTLGGAISYRMKDGFTSAGHAVRLSGGAFGRWSASLQAGGHDQASTRGYFAAAEILHEAGWRQHSPSRVARVFSSAAWRGPTWNADLSLTAGGSRLDGDGLTPNDLMAADRRAIFTFPDITRNGLWQLSAKGSRAFGGSLLATANVYYRRQDSRVVNGNTASFQPCPGSAVLAVACSADEVSGDLAPVLDRSGAPVPFTTPAGPLSAVNDLARSLTGTLGATLQATMTRPIAGRSNRLVVGTSFDADQARFDADGELGVITPGREIRAVGIFARDLVVRLHARSLHAGVYATDTLDATSRLSLTGSASLTATRLHLRDQAGAALTGDHAFARFNPAAGVTFQLTPTWNAYGGYSESSRVPTAIELTCADPAAPCRLPNALLADPPLAQIAARTVETGIRARFHDARLAFAAFSTRIANDLVFVGNGEVQNQGYFANAGSTARQGVETRVEVAPSRRVTLFGSYTFLSARFGRAFDAASPNNPLATDGVLRVKAGNRLPGIPAHSFKAGASITLMRRALLDVDVRAVSSRWLRGDEANLLSPLPGYAVADLALSFALFAHAGVTARVDNLLDARYSSFGLLGDARPVLGPSATDPRFVAPGAPRAAYLELVLR